MRIAYQGEPGAYSEAAALVFSPHAETLPCKTFDEVFDAVMHKRATHGIVPMENSIGGTIHRNYDLLVDHELAITGEVELDVVHCLLALPGTTIEDVKIVYSHPQALAQCDRFLRTLSGVEITATYDTAGSAKMIADELSRVQVETLEARLGEPSVLRELLGQAREIGERDVWTNDRHMLAAAPYFGLTGRSVRP